ncbi:hypothetical protein BDM02DRAFT_3133220 [Thelephora ganbajun]|uniref:Uncharacterized protein n=1 Tax=Thelephora ganbajun TaxID=370292 RepID=A0ACB6YYD5_THEGA|nr:hypothetical protein BDM02DRAFT_3133220 [Thelephora ganbajun]
MSENSMTNQNCGVWGPREVVEWNKKSKEQEGEGITVLGRREEQVGNEGREAVRNEGTLADQSKAWHLGKAISEQMKKGGSRLPRREREKNGLEVGEHLLTNQKCGIWEMLDKAEREVLDGEGDKGENVHCPTGNAISEQTSKGGGELPKQEREKSGLEMSGRIAGTALVRGRRTGNLDAVACRSWEGGDEMRRDKKGGGIAMYGTQISKIGGMQSNCKPQGGGGGFPGLKTAQWCASESLAPTGSA